MQVLNMRYDNSLNSLKSSQKNSEDVVFVTNLVIILKIMCKNSYLVCRILFNQKYIVELMFNYFRI